MAVPLQFADIPASVVTIIQGTIVLAVVIANEVARRLTLRSAERAGAGAVAPGGGSEGATGRGSPPPSDDGPRDTTGDRTGERQEVQR